MSTRRNARRPESGSDLNIDTTRLGDGYDEAGNLSNRVQNAQTNVFRVNNLNQLTSTVRTNPSATVAGFTTLDATSVTVAANGGAATAALRYADRTYPACYLPDHQQRLPRWPKPGDIQQTSTHRPQLGRFILSRKGVGPQH